MSKRDFFRVIIKLFGLYVAILAIFTWIPQTFGSYVSLRQDPAFIFLFIGSLALSILMIYLLLFNVDKVINLLKLDKGFDDDVIELGNLSPKSIIVLSLILIGGILLVDNVPIFLTNTFYSFKDMVGVKQNYSRLMDFVDPIKKVDYFEWLISFINIVVGYFLLTNYSVIVSKLLKEKESNIED
jgi:uncharacterized protein with PQ loop repeat